MYTSTETIHTFFRQFVKYFETAPYHPEELGFFSPHYHHVQLFTLPELKEDTHTTEAWIRLERYAEEVFIQ
jgi:hypothetical protein